MVIILSDIRCWFSPIGCTVIMTAMDVVSPDIETEVGDEKEMERFNGV